MNIPDTTPTTRTSTLILSTIFLTVICSLSASAEDDKTDKANSAIPKKSLEAVSKDVMKFYAAQPNNGHREGTELTVSEYQIKGLWEQMGMQLFRLDRGKLFSWNILLADGKLTRLEVPTHGGAGLMKGALHDKNLYLTSDWGSGILRTALYQISSDKDGKIRVKQEGVISSSPKGQFDRKFLEDKTVKKVMNLLQPLRHGKAMKMKLD